MQVIVPTACAENGLETGQMAKSTAARQELVNNLGIYGKYVTYTLIKNEGC